MFVGEVDIRLNEFSIILNLTVLHVQMPSGRDINVDSDCVAVIGQVSNPSHLDIHWGSPQFVMDLGLRPKKGKLLKHCQFL